MSYLLDTNVLSELRRKQPDAGVVDWIERRQPDRLFLSVLTLGEIRRGIERLDDEKRRIPLLEWLEVDLQRFFLGRILSVNEEVADRWGRIVGASARPLPAIDSLIAATAAEHDLVLVTRNVKDFAGTPIEVFDPWSS